MKTKTLLFIAMILVLGCCSDDDNKPMAEIDKLPPATQHGANKAGCLVNGKAFLPKGYITTGNLRCNYINGLDFSLIIGERVENQINSVAIISYNTTLEEGQTYILTQYQEDSKYGFYSIGSAPPPRVGYYHTTSVITGEFTITRHDFDNAFLSGTFWFDAVNSEGEIIEVREGRFDVEY